MDKKYGSEEKKEDQNEKEDVQEKKTFIIEEGLNYMSGSEEHKSSVVGNDQVISDQQKYYEDYYG